MIYLLNLTIANIYNCMLYCENNYKWFKAWLADLKDTTVEISSLTNMAHF